MEVTVANARKLRAIYQNDRKCDELDARMLAKLLRVDPSLLSPIKHGSEQAQKDLLAIKMRDSLVRQRVHIITTIRGLLKSTGLRLPTTSTSCFHKKAQDLIAQQPELLPAIQPGLDALTALTTQIKHYEKHITQAAQKDFFWNFDEHHRGNVWDRLRRPEGWHELEGRAERECGEVHCDDRSTRKLMPVRRPLGTNLTNGKLG
jgi:hypothetical protein